MKAKLLYYTMNPESRIVPKIIYLEQDFDQADKDLECLSNLSSGYEIWYLQEVELYQPSKGITHEPDETQF